MVQPASRGDAHRCKRRAQADDPSRVHTEKSKPRSQPDLQLLQRQSITVPRGGWQRLCLLGGTGDCAEQAQPAGGRASGTHAGSLEKIPARAEKTDAGCVAESSSDQGIVEGCAGGGGSGVGVRSETRRLLGRLMRIALLIVWSK